jgi:hypothetical protein
MSLPGYRSFLDDADCWPTGQGQISGPHLHLGEVVSAGPTQRPKTESALRHSLRFASAVCIGR